MELELETSPETAYLLEQWVKIKVIKLIFMYKNSHHCLTPCGIKTQDLDSD